MGNKDIFDAISNSYVTTERISLADISADAVRSYLIDTHDKTAIDFGCGTGLIGINLFREFKSILFLDSSDKMIDVVKNKIERLKISNATALCYDLENGEIPDITVDYILMSQVLLHIKDYADILSKLRKMLNNNGHLIITDFDKNDLVVSALVHNGFEQNELKELLRTLGFSNIQSRRFYNGEGIFMGKDASLFVMDAQIVFNRK
jgi:ubiquinone/menaquinone biosynthesis C-methylase UbiE